MPKQTRLSRWDFRFLRLANHVSTWSKDPSTKVGCVITDRKHRILSTGFNGLPAGVKDTSDRFSNRRIKLLLVQHAERNAISFAGKNLDDSVCYTWPLPPCASCAGALIQAGVGRVVARSLTPSHHRWEEDFLLSLEMYQEKGIIVDIEDLANEEISWLLKS